MKCLSPSSTRTKFVDKFKDKDKDKDGLLPRSEYMEFGCRGVHHTYIHICINTHKYTYLHTYILTHNVNLGIQSLKYHNTPSLKYIYRYVKNNPKK